MSLRLACGRGETGRRPGLRNRRASAHEGSTPSARTRSTTSGQMSEALCERGIFGAEPVDLRTVDGDDLAEGERADARRPRSVLREKRPLPDHRARAELARALWSFHRDLSLEHDVESGAGIAALDQHLPGAERELRAHLLELFQIVIIHG